MTSVDNPNRRSRIAWLHNSGMSVLLALLVSTVFVIPALVPDGARWHLITDILMTLIMISGVVAVFDHRRFAIVLIAVGVVVVVARWMEWAVPAGILPALREGSALIGFMVLAAAVSVNVFSSGHAIGDRVFGAIVLYLLIGLLWAIIYSIVDRALPGAFAGRPSSDSGLADWTYFSFVTLTTVGYGDITPVARAARALAMSEALIGQLYPAIIIARLVSLQLTEK